MTPRATKRLHNHTAALRLFLCYYNSCRIHKTLLVTSCMAEGVASRAWEIADLVALLPTVTGQKREPYKKREGGTAHEV